MTPDDSPTEFDRLRDQRDAIEERAAEHCRMSVSGLADFGITLAAKQQGFTEKPPRRLS